MSTAHCEATEREGKKLQHVLPCDASVEACPSGYGLALSKCQGCDGLKSYSAATNVTTLLAVAARRAAAGLIDDLGGLLDMKAWLYRGGKDACPS